MNNLNVEVDALVTQLVFDGKRAAGVEYLQHGKTVTAHAEREVILCGGVINSPQLLMLSGIGDPDELRAHDIAVKVALPGVGKNLQDHISASVAYGRKEPGTLHRAMRFDRIVPALANAYWRGEGIATELPTGQMAFLKSRPDAALPDVELIFNAAPMTAAPYFWPFRKPYADSYACRAVVLRPESRGRIELISADPRQPVRIRQNFLATDNDRKTLRAGLRMVRDICRQAPMQAFMTREIAPGDGAVSDADLDAHIAANSITVHHPLGTCKMGPRLRSARRGRSGAARVRHRGAARGRRRGDARPGRRPYQCADHHDRRKGRRPDPRPGTSRGGPACRRDGIVAALSAPNVAGRKPRSGLHNPVTPAYKLWPIAALRH